MDVLSLSNIIKDVGIAVVVGAAFIYMSLYNNKKNNAIQERIMGQYDSKLLEIIEILKSEVINILKTVDMHMEHIYETMNGDMYRRISVTAVYSFRASIINIMTLIYDVKRDNNLEDKDYVENKVRMSLENLFNERKEKLSAYIFNGKNLSEYVDKEWIEKLNTFCLKAVYDGKNFDLRCYLNPVENIYKDIELKFLNKIKNG